MNRILFLLAFLTGIFLNAQADCVVNTDGLQPNNSNDIKATILLEGSTASSWQPGENIENSFDGNPNSIYHSNWSNTEFPVVLNYRLNGYSEIDYMKYIPRGDAGMNGNFGNVSISYNTIENPEFIPLLDHDFEQSGAPKVVHFQNPISPLNIQIIVHDGYGNFASCAEMEFYKSGSVSNPEPPVGIFADEIFSELQSGVSQDQIDNISSPFYKSLAQCLFDETYDKKYRVGEHEVYLPLTQIHKELKVSGYNPYENPTGIAFPVGEKIVLFAENIQEGKGVYLKIKNFEAGYYSLESLFQLENGLNVFDISYNTGLGYISYYNSDLSLPDVKINIVSGKVSGVFHYQNSTDEDWAELLSLTTYPKLDIVGKYSHLLYDRDALLIGNPDRGKELIEKYDLINRYERLLMGLYKYDRSPKNRIFALGEYGSGYYAGGSGIHLDWTWGIPSMADPDNLDLWGIPHEYGHVNQIRPDLKWIGTTEVTNNIYSAWVYYKMNPQGHNYTRLESESVSPAPGMPSTAGGRINGAINSTYVNGNPLQHTENYDVFKVLVPFWQLELYYQQAGALRNAPELDFDYPGDYTGVDYARWYGTVAEISRNTDSLGMSYGEMAMNFVKNTCDAVQEDLIDFFTYTGFLKPIDANIDDYGVGNLKITQEMVDETIAYIQSKNYEQPVSPVMHYLSAHSVNTFKNQLPVQGETGVGVAQTGSLLRIQNSEWPNAVAFEVYDTEGQLMQVAIVGTGDVSLATTRLYYIGNADKVYAVGYDGEKILVWPDSMSVTEADKSEIRVYPNPLEKGEWLHLDLKVKNEIYSGGLYSLDGKMLIEFKGNQTEIEKRINQKLQVVNPGVYMLNLRNLGGEIIRVKVVRK